MCFSFDGGEVGGGSVVISIYSRLLSEATTLYKMNENEFKCHKSSNDDVQMKKKEKKTQSDRGNGWKNRTRTNNHYYIIGARTR